jgi:hypothetical protein
MLKISNTLLAVSQLTSEKSAKTAQKFMAYLDKVYRSVGHIVLAENAYHTLFYNHFISLLL